jgi:hypothetical protein
MHVVFIHGPAASGKHTIGSRLSAITGLPLFHNHLAVDTAKSLFDFGSPSFNRVRAAVWLTAFAEAASINRSFIFTFQPEASVDPSLIDQLVQSVQAVGGIVRFVELKCSNELILQRLGNASRKNFGKLADTDLYKSIEQQGAFQFPPLPASIITINTGELSPDEAAERISSILPAL